MRTKLSGFKLMAQCVACLITVLKFSLRQPMYYCSWPLGCLMSLLSILSILLCPKHIVNHSASKTTCLQSSQSNNHSLSLPFFPMQSKDLMSFLLFSFFSYSLVHQKILLALPINIQQEFGLHFLL